MELFKIKKHLTPFQIIIIGFAAVVILGALILMLPISSESGRVTPFNESAFTAVSAVCVTGLAVQDTGSYWSAFGQAVILTLIQIGGLGVVTVGVALTVLSGKKISLMQRSTMQESITASKMGGIVRFTGFIIRTVLVIELLGALVMMPVFCRDFGAKGIWMSVFHSVSAFCNAGFDIMGTADAPFVSLSSYINNPLINIVVMLLIITGGISFMTWDDIRTHRHRLGRYSMQSKVILTVSALLIFIPAAYLYIFEYTNLPLKERLLTSLFQSITTRTAGFNTADLTQLSLTGMGIFIILMLIGGSPGSTAGGMKTTTVAVLFSAMVSEFRRAPDTQLYKRRISDETVKKAAAILMMYLTLFTTGAFIISTIEKIPIEVCLFETASAVGTVGLTLGITTKLSIVSQCLLMILMFIGRVGGLTLIYAALSDTRKNLSRVPQERITVG